MPAGMMPAGMMPAGARPVSLPRIVGGTGTNGASGAFPDPRQLYIQQSFNVTDPAVFEHPPAAGNFSGQYGNQQGFATGQDGQDPLRSIDRIERTEVSQQSYGEGWNLQTPSVHGAPPVSVSGGHGQDLSILGASTLGGGFNTKKDRKGVTLAPGGLKAMGDVELDGPDIEGIGMYRYHSYIF